jgi:hypothetical protein
MDQCDRPRQSYVTARLHAVRSVTWIAPRSRSLPVAVTAFIEIRDERLC